MKSLADFGNAARPDGGPIQWAASARRRGSRRRWFDAQATRTPTIYPKLLLSADEFFLTPEGARLRVRRGGFEEKNLVVLTRA
jgi:hypothetical protein